MRRLVVYSEGREHWSHFEPVVRELTGTFGRQVLFVTSDDGDPVWSQAPNANVHPFYIGGGSLRTIFFAMLDADILLTTMPDLGLSYIKKSPHQVKYVYLHHSLVSMHMAYREGAFDCFDVILCAGPHHESEARARQGVVGREGAVLVPHGYGRLDRLLQTGVQGPRSSSCSGPLKVLFAPTWGNEPELEVVGAEMIRKLMAAGLRVTFRPHPMTLARAPALIRDFRQRFGRDGLFRLDDDVDSIGPLVESDIMITDWSGAAFDFAFGLERPVLFVDLPKKVRNPNHGLIGIEPVELSLRGQLGRVIAVRDAPNIAQHVLDMMSEPTRWRQSVQELRGRTVYNVGRSGYVGARYLDSLAPSTGVARVQ
jgi:YidC/Oxa1 family membrane protein insertase